jgi:hypothetical protein
MPPMVMPPALNLEPPYQTMAAHGEGADELHRRQEEGAEPGGAVAGAVHLAGQLLKLGEVLLLAAQGLDHAHAHDVLVVGAGDLAS